MSLISKREIHQALEALMVAVGFPKPHSELDTEQFAEILHAGTLVAVSEMEEAHETGGHLDCLEIVSDIITFQAEETLRVPAMRIVQGPSLVQ
jgi:hypothetical protein